MRFVELRSEPRWPAESCCNCGAADGVELRRARLAKTDVAVLPGLLAYGEQRRVVLQLPLCGGCAPSASRLRPTGAQYVVVWGGAALLLFLAQVALLPTGLLDGLGGWKWAPCVLPAVVATILSVAWYATRRPAGRALSYYQPVFLRAAGRDYLIFGFENDAYASAFAAANPGSRQGDKVRQRKLVESP